MALNLGGLIDSLMSDDRQIRALTEGLEKSNAAMESQIGNGLSQSDFLDQSIQKRKSLGAREKHTLLWAKSVAKYLNGMEDPTGEPPSPKFSVYGAKPTYNLVYALHQTPNHELQVAPCDAMLKSTWGSYFPLTFAKSVPPSGGIKELEAVAPPVPIGSLVGVMTPMQSHKSMVSKYAKLIHKAAKSIMVNITYTVSNGGPASITGPVS